MPRRWEGGVALLSCRPQGSYSPHWPQGPQGPQGSPSEHQVALLSCSGARLQNTAIVVEAPSCIFRHSLETTAMSIFTSSVHVIYLGLNILQWYKKWCRYFWRISLPEPFQLPHSARSIQACLAGFHLLVFWIFSREKSAGPHFAPCRVTPVKILDSLKELNTRTSADGKLHFISLENSSILEI